MENLDDPIRMPAPDRPNILKPRADGKASQALVWWSLVVLAIVVAFGAILYEIEKPQRAGHNAPTTTTGTALPTQRP
jgi:hypothetical protein